MYKQITENTFVTTDNVNDFLKVINIKEVKFYVTDTDIVNKKIEALEYYTKSNIDDKQKRENQWEIQNLKDKYLFKKIDNKFIYKEQTGYFVVTPFTKDEREKQAEYTNDTIIKYKIEFKDDKQIIVNSSLFNSKEEIQNYIKQNFNIEFLK